MGLNAQIVLKIRMDGVSVANEVRKLHTQILLFLELQVEHGEIDKSRQIVLDFTVSSVWKRDTGLLCHLATKSQNSCIICISVIHTEQFNFKVPLRQHF